MVHAGMFGGLVMPQKKSLNLEVGIKTEQVKS